MKAILEIDAPASCRECRLFIAEETYFGLSEKCHIKADTDAKTYGESRSPEYPLKIVPETPEAELKTCPFCSGEPTITHLPPQKNEPDFPYYPGEHVFMCTKCSCQFSAGNDRQAAIAVWNRRARP